MDSERRPLEPRLDRNAEPLPVWRGWLARLGSIIWIGACAWAFYGLHKEWSQFHLAGINESFRMIGPRHLALALVLTALSYACNAALALLAYRWIHIPLTKPLRDFKTAFIASAFTMNAGGTLFGGGSIRMRFAKMHGISTTEVGKITLFAALASWMGHAWLCGLLLLAAPPPLDWLTPPIAICAGSTLLIVCTLLVFAGQIWPKRWPSPGLTLVAILISALDWTAAGLAMWALFPEQLPMSAWSLVAVVVIAQAVAAGTQVPGGIGVLEFAVTKALAGVVAAPALVGTLVTYRLIYYLLPFFAAIGLLSLHELRRRSEAIARGGMVALRGWGIVAPRLASFLALGGGLILLISASIPMEVSRRTWLESLLPLPFVEGSHFLSSLAGALLIVLARGLQRRIRAAWVLCVISMAGGIIFSLAKGLDWEEALALTFMLACLLPFHRYFHRRSALWTHRFTPGWWLVLIALVGLSIWIGFFTARHVPYQNELWWQFTMDGDASRFLRGASGAICLFAIVALAQALRPTKPRKRDPMDFSKVEKLVEASDHADAALALLGDKDFLCAEDGRCGLMYADQGRSRIVMGDPLGDAARADDLLWCFAEKAQDEGMRPIFYAVSVAEMPRLVDMGFKLFKLGEEARVNIAAFSMESADTKKLRKSLSRLRSNGCSFSILSREAVAARLPVLRAVSDAWLAEHKAAEKGFSLGFFSDDYIKRFPCAVIEDASGGVLAFANLWMTSDKAELSVDLMRHLPSAPKGVMEAMFIELIRWGHGQGFTWFNLGMAPLSGLSSHPLAPLWHKIAGGIFHRGESFYNFQGLRVYKDKFNPEWQPRYIAVQDSWSLPGAIFDVTSLISGGFKRTFSRSR